MKEQAELAQVKHELDRMDNVAYDLHCNLEIAVDALKQSLEELERSRIFTKAELNARIIIKEALERLDIKQTQA